MIKNKRKIKLKIYRDGEVKIKDRINKNKHKNCFVKNGIRKVEKWNYIK